MGNTNGTLALVFGLIGICCCGFILGPIAIILGAVGLKKDDEQTLSIVGIILGVIALACWIFSFIFLTAMLEDILQDYGY